jgi:hypothetical protein
VREFIPSDNTSFNISKELTTMKRMAIVFFLSVSFFGPHFAAIAQESSTTPSTESASISPQDSDESEIKNALSAGPDFVTDKATVMDWPKPGEQHGRILRMGSNGWTCMPDVGKPTHDPMCGDETMMKWMEATFAGHKPNIDRVGVAYMLQGEADPDQFNILLTTPPKGKDWYYVGPHVMLVLPDKDKPALKYVNHDISTSQPYVAAWSTSSPVLVIPIARPHQEVKITANGSN